MKQSASIEHCFRLPFEGSPVFAMGGRQRNTLCATSGGCSYLLRVVGDLDSAAVCAKHEVAATEMLVWLARIPAVIARELDPAIHSSHFAIELADSLGVPHLAVQHHHAHVAAVCAEHGLMRPVIGLVLDDCALGSDGTCRGGELLWVDGDKCLPQGHLALLPKPGGEVAQRESWRMVAGVLHCLGRTQEIVQRYGYRFAAADLTTMLEEGRNCPMTSSAALLMAAVAGLLRLIGDEAGQCGASNVLQEAARCYFNTDYVPLADSLWNITAQGDLDFFPLLDQLADETDAQRGAASFHANLIAGAAEWVVAACTQCDTRQVVLSGVCLMNPLLAAGLHETLERRGLEVFEARQLIPDDSALALGQAWVAQRLLHS